jgi:hypothetical protein
MVVANTNNGINETKNSGISMKISIAMAMQRRHGAHRPIKHIHGFTRSHWMPPSGECLRRIAPAAAMVDEFE